MLKKYNNKKIIIFYILFIIIISMIFNSINIYIKNKNNFSILKINTSKDDY